MRAARTGDSPQPPISLPRTASCGEAKVAASTSLLVEAAPMAELMRDLLRKDPNYLVA
jgi:hypothetical protein